MNNLVFGMKVISFSQLPGGSYSHPNMALDAVGSDSGIDFWFAQGYWKAIAGPWGNGTYFFMSCDAKGAPAAVHCADNKDRIVTLALTHSARQYVRPEVGKVYATGTPIYEEGTLGKTSPGTTSTSRSRTGSGPGRAGTPRSESTGWRASSIRSR